MELRSCYAMCHGDLEILPSGLSGPRTEPVVGKSLVIIAVGGASVFAVDKIVKTFGFTNFSFVLFHYDNDSSWSQFEWYKQVLSIRMQGAMKWWFIKRFIVPYVVAPYLYLFFLDEDVDLDDFEPLGYIKILNDYNVSLSQPAMKAHNSWEVTVRQDPAKIGRWTNFVEIGPVTVISSQIWRECIWDVIENDLTSGWGMDLSWHHICSLQGWNRTAIIDFFSFTHRSTLSAHKTTYDPEREQKEYYRRLGIHLPVVKPRTLRHFEPSDKVVQKG